MPVATGRRPVRRKRHDAVATVAQRRPRVGARRLGDGPCYRRPPPPPPPLPPIVAPPLHGAAARRRRRMCHCCRDCGGGIVARRHYPRCRHPPVAGERAAAPAAAADNSHAAATLWSANGVPGGGGSCHRRLRGHVLATRPRLHRASAPAVRHRHWQRHPHWHVHERQTATPPPPPRRRPQAPAPPAGVNHGAAGAATGHVVERHTGAVGKVWGGGLGRYKTGNDRQQRRHGGGGELAMSRTSWVRVPRYSQYPVICAPVIWHPAI